MGDRPREDAEQPTAPAPPRPTREPGAYYYDDQTNYEPYDPSADDDEGEDEPRGDESATGDS